MPMDKASTKLPRPKGWLAVDSITFVYPGSKDPLLRGVSFSLEPGESLGLVGPAAAGKTTLARLMAGTLVPNHGHVRLDGMEMSQWPTTERGQYVGYVPQGIELFNGTVAENIARMQDGDREAVIEAAQIVGAHETILSLPDGYETEIGDAGAALSGGQRQQVALARAVYGDPCLLVLDEPSASLDSQGEAFLLQALETLRERNVTAVVVAHRPTLLQKVDKLLLLRDGMVEAFGPRSELLPRLVRPAPALQAPKQLGKCTWLT
jgi:ABC-type protease/lipase transport system fused ATPase/permease subunit